MKDKTLRQLMDFQKFAGNPLVEKAVSHGHEFIPKGQPVLKMRRLDISELSELSAAGVAYTKMRKKENE